MRPATRGVRAGPVLVALLLGVALVAGWGVPIDAARVAALTEPDQGIQVSAARAWMALRPLPTVVAGDVRVSLASRVRLDATSLSLRLAIMPLLGGTLAWRSAHLRGGTLAVRERARTGTLHCETVRGRVVVAGARRARLDLRGDCRGPRLVLRGASYRGDVSWRDEDGVQARGRVAGDAMRLWGNVDGEAFSAALRVGADGMRLDGVRIDLGGGSVGGRARWMDAPGRRRLAVAFEGAGDDAEAALGDAPLGIAGRWVVRGRGRSVTPPGVAVVREAAGAGRLLVQDGRVAKLDVGGALLDGLEVWRGRRRRRLRRRFPDVFHREGLHFERAVVGVRMRAGRCQLAPLHVHSRSYRASGQGRIGRDGSVRAGIDLVPSDALADALVGRGALRAILRGDREELTLPIEVRGRIGALRARPAPQFARDVLERFLGGRTPGRMFER